MRPPRFGGRRSKEDTDQEGSRGYGDLEEEKGDDYLRGKATSQNCTPVRKTEKCKSLQKHHGSRSKTHLNTKK